MPCPRSARSAKRFGHGWARRLSSPRTRSARRSAMDRSRRPMAEGFRLDKRISITIVVLVLVQTFSALIWAGAAGERIAHAEEEAGRVQELSERAARL